MRQVKRGVMVVNAEEMKKYTWNSGITSSIIIIFIHDVLLCLRVACNDSIICPPGDTQRVKRINVKIEEEQQQQQQKQQKKTLMNFVRPPETCIVIVGSQIMKMFECSSNKNMKFTG